MSLWGKATPTDPVRVGPKGDPGVVDYALVDQHIGVAVAQEMTRALSGTSIRPQIVYVKDQVDDQWVIDHDFVAMPHVTVVDTAGSVILCDVSYASPTRIVLSFAFPCAGKAFVG